MLPVYQYVSSTLSRSLWDTMALVMRVLTFGRGRCSSGLSTRGQISTRYTSTTSRLKPATLMNVHRNGCSPRYCGKNFRATKVSMADVKMSSGTSGALRGENELIEAILSSLVPCLSSAVGGDGYGASVWHSYSALPGIATNLELRGVVSL